MDANDWAKALKTSKISEVDNKEVKELIRQISDLNNPPKEIQQKLRAILKRIITRH